MLRYWLIILLTGLLFSCSSDSDSVEPEDKKVEEPEESEVISINSIADLIKYAAVDSVEIKMEAGTYLIDDKLLGKGVVLDKYDGGSVVGEYPVTTLLHFSGNNSVYDLAEVEINVDIDIYPELGNTKINEILISGNSNTIKGLSFNNIGDGIPEESAIMMVVLGNNNTIQDVDLFIKGSYPYGYGFLLGKSSGSLVPLHKHSSLLVCGTGTELLGCNVVTRAFGHGIVMQGAVDTHIEDCYVEGAMRTTDEMLAETSGAAYSVNFRSDYPPGEIVAGQMIALSEDGVRTYADGPLVPTKTSNVTVLNTTVKNMRGGFDLVACSGDRIINGCTAIGCQTQGFSGGTGISIFNSKGDAMYGPLLAFWYKSSKNCTAVLELVNTESDYPPERLAEINGTGHNITIKNYEGNSRTTETPIVFGESFWADTQAFRTPDIDPDELAGASGVTLKTETSMPVYLNKLANSCYVTTNSSKVTDEGSKNSITITE